MSSSADDQYEILARGLTWQELTVGRRFQTGARTITESDLVSFVAGMGLYESLFMNADEGFPAGDRTGRLVPGLLPLGIAEGLVVQTNMIGGTGMALLSLQVDVRGPTFVGDTIRVRLEVTESRATSTPGRGIVTTRNEILNQDDHVVIEYQPVRMIAGGE